MLLGRDGQQKQRLLEDRVENDALQPHRLLRCLFGARQCAVVLCTPGKQQHVGLQYAPCLAAHMSASPI